MINRLQQYHTALRATGSSGYPNMSFYNPQHQQPPFPLAGSPEPLYDPYQRLAPMPTMKRYQQQPQMSLGLKRYGSGLPGWRPQSTNLLNARPTLDYRR